VVASSLHYLKLFIFHWNHVVPAAKFIHEVISHWKGFITDGQEQDVFNLLEDSANGD
jgi:hypothetical protein